MEFRSLPLCLTKGSQKYGQRELGSRNLDRVDYFVLLVRSYLKNTKKSPLWR